VSIAQIVLTLIFYVWMFAVLALIWKIWRQTAGHVQAIEKTMIQATLAVAEAVRMQAEAAQRHADKLIEHVERKPP